MTRIQIRRGTSSQWATSNPILASGEPGLDTTTGDYKFGDGTSTWSALASRYVALPTAWVAPTLLNSWVNFGGSAVTAAYRKVGDMVQVRGQVKSGTIGSVVFVLPVGFRAPVENFFGTVSNGAFGGLKVDETGNVIALTGSNVSLSLNCQFSVTA